MRSRAARVTVGAIAGLALSAAAYIVFHSQQQIERRRADFSAFEAQVHQATDALESARAGQQAYVAAGQGMAFWVPKVTASLDSIPAILDGLDKTAVSDDARQALMAARGSVTDIGSLDKRIRDYLRSGQQLMASDVVFTEGREAVVIATQKIEEARVAEQQALSSDETAKRKMQAVVAGTAAVLALLVIALLAFAGAPEALHAEGPALAAFPASLPEPGLPAPLPEVEPRGEPVDETLASAAALCTELGRARDFETLKTLLRPAADLMDAIGLIVWLRTEEDDELRPVVSHGYPAKAIARMAAVPVSAENAVAAAYRTGSLQVVWTPGSSTNAVVAPLLSQDGCIGALAAEVGSGRESVGNVHSLATIVAAQLATILAGSAGTVSRPNTQQRAAGA